MARKTQSTVQLTDMVASLKKLLADPSFALPPDADDGSKVNPGAGLSGRQLMFGARRM